MVYPMTFVPFTNLRGLKYLMFLIEDLSLYFYSQRSYNGTMLTILTIVNEIEEIQWSLLKEKAKIDANPFSIPTSKLIDFSNQKHMEIDGVDDSFVRAIFSFLIFGVPPILVATLFFRGIFKCLFKYQISVYLRRYFFILPCLLQGLIEGNIGFFTYVFFRQAFLAFSFKFADKLAIVMAVMFFFGVVMVACCFFLIFNHLLKKKIGYFIYCFYRTFPSMVYLNLQLVMRGIVRGVIHSCLHNHYEIEIVFLCLMEAAMIVLAIVIEKKSKIFMHQTMFMLSLCYHFLFILLNLTLLA